MTHGAASAAHELGVSLVDVQQMICRRELYACVSGGRLEVPEWQLVRRPGEPDAHVLPHLTRVLAVLPSEVHPFVVRAFFLRELVGVDADGVPLVVRDWLAQGGAPEAVEAVAVLRFGAGPALRRSR
ncbi:hypothetical protein [Aeromicrobium sp. IC_218]|uniref:hypothetical protein n=1 Tax=Aeromicrobium sp. IC_218 TaxID=2545468 RepID=UPI00103B5B2B|nr:hypothetical protein [Aeromicrobium sp. IC_218]TCI99314.1 hypothetical protein E0W78_06110 [Aeromicrobium sp. IC_218]